MPGELHENWVMNETLIAGKSLLNVTAAAHCCSVSTINAEQHALRSGDASMPSDTTFCRYSSCTIQLEVNKYLSFNLMVIYMFSLTEKKNGHGVFTT